VVPSRRVASVPPDSVRRELDRILRSAAFAQADRLRSFLSFVVERTLEGEAREIKESVIAVQVCGRPPGFDSAADPIVRVDANRLRSRLKTYYQTEGRDDPLEIELPKGSYAPRFRQIHTADDTTVSAGPPIASPREEPSLAVLPFVNLRAEPSPDFFSDGLTEELINLLSRTDGLRVVARTSVFQFKDKAVDVRQIAKLLGATHVLEGSVRQAERRVRVTVQLTDAASGCLLWAGKHERELVEVFAIQDEICASIATALRLKLVAGVAADRSTDVEAHRSYLMGRYYWNLRTTASLERSTECYRVALERDPQYALPYCGLADSLAVQVLNEYVDPMVAMPQAETHARRAAALGPRLSEPLVSLGVIKSIYRWEWESAAADFQHAIELSPGSSTPHYLYAVVNLATRGIWDAALRQMHTALALDPMSPLLQRDLGLIHYLKRDYAEAEKHLRAAHDLDTGFTGHLFWLARTLTEQQRFDEALSALEIRRTQSPTNARLEAMRCVTLARMGRRKGAEQCLSHLQTLSARQPISSLTFALAHLGLGHGDDAYELLSRAVSDKSGALYQLAVDPIYDPLRADARFQTLLTRMNLPIVSLNLVR
jgi:adenylate cyclase